MQGTFSLYLDGEGQNTVEIANVGVGKLNTTVVKAMHCTALEKLGAN
jgi:hypothetical protein